MPVVTKSERPLLEFGQWIQGENFECLTYCKNSTEQVAALEKLITGKIDEIFPRKEITIFKNDKEFMNKELRMLKRQKSREYRRHRKSKKYQELLEKFTKIKRENSKKFVDKIEELKNANVSQFYRKVKELGSRLGEDSSNPFTLPKHLELNLEDKEAAEAIAKHFSSISQEYPPIDANTLPKRVKAKIFATANKTPTIEEYEVYDKLKKRKMKNSLIPGYIPKKLKKEFLPELAKPLAHPSPRVYCLKLKMIYVILVSLQTSAKIMNNFWRIG